ncbi:MAG: metallophosphoesterase [Clostridia bacterium]|nr:metallophosphoesterase [Clostridia bacterium]
MLSFIVKAARILISAVLALTTIFSPVTGKKLQKIKHYKDDCKVSIGVISDTHLKDNFIRLGMLEFGLLDMSKAKDRLDAVVFDGDITDHGYIEHWEGFAKTMSKYDIADQTILVAGNHDTWGPDRDNIETVKQTFIDYNKKVSDRDINGMYYTTNVKGYPVIVLGSEEDHTSATISQTQIDWFAAEMEKASKTGLPIFVFLHQSINGTHGLPYNWGLDETDPYDEGGIGEASDDILHIIEKYNNVFYISGHIHAGLSNEKSHSFYTSVEKHDGYTLINVPCYEYPDVQRGNYPNNGTGYVIEVYENEVMLRARNFSTGRWLTRYDETIELIK